MMPLLHSLLKKVCIYMVLRGLTAQQRLKNRLYLHQRLLDMFVDSCNICLFSAN